MSVKTVGKHTVNELIAALEVIRDAGGGDRPVYMCPNPEDPDEAYCVGSVIAGEYEFEPSESNPKQDGDELIEFNDDGYEMYSRKVVRLAWD